MDRQEEFLNEMDELRKEFTQEMIDQKEEAETQHQ